MKKRERERVIERGQGRGRVSEREREREREKEGGEGGESKKESLGKSVFLSLSFLVRSTNMLQKSLIG